MSDENVVNELIDVVAEFVVKKVQPVTRELEARDEYPGELIDAMASMGLFGMVIPEEYGGLDLGFKTYWRVVAEISKGWMSLGGALNSHSIVAYLLKRFGTEEQKKRYLPYMATGEVRAALAMTEANAGSDVAAVQTRVERSGKDLIINGSKWFITNGERSGIVLVLGRTNANISPRYKGLSLIIAPRGDGMYASRHIEKLGYKGIETVELVFDGYRCSEDNILGLNEGMGFYQVMVGSEVGRLNVAARAVGVARLAFERARNYATERFAFGHPIGDFQAIQFLLADMATSIAAAEGLNDKAAVVLDAGQRADVEVGMAKLFATEMCLKATMDSMRIHGGYGYTNEFEIERLYRDAPQMVVAEGTNEIQRVVIAKSLLRGVGR